MPSCTTAGHPWAGQRAVHCQRPSVSPCLHLGPSCTRRRDGGEDQRIQWMSKDDYGCTASTSQQIIKASLQRVKRKVPYMYTLEDFNQDPRDGTLAILSVRDSEASKPPPQTPPENSTLDSRPLNLLFDRWIMWEKTPPAVEALGLCRNAISRSRRDDEAGSAIPVRLRPVHSRMMRRIRITKAKIRPVSQLCMLVMPRCVHETLLD